MCLESMGPSHGNPIAWVNLPRLLHLGDLDAGTLTLCGLSLSESPIGQYWEYLDEGPDGEPEFRRTIGAGDRQVWQPCPECLRLRRPVLCSMGAPS